MNIDVKKWLRIAAIGLIAILILISAWRFLNSGTIVVNSESQDVVLRIQDEAGKKKAEKKTKQLKRRLQKGKYIVFATNSSGASTKVVEVEARQTANVTLNVKELKPPEQVYGLPGLNLSSTKDELVFVSPKTKTASRLASGKAIAAAYLPSFTGILDLQMHQDGFGILRTNKGKLYEVNGDVTKDVSNTVFASLKGDYKIALGATGNNYAVSIGKKIHIKTPSEAAAIAVYTTKEDNMNIAYDGNDKLAIFKLPDGYPFSDDHGGGERKEESRINPDGYSGNGITIYNSQTKKTTELDKDRLVLNAVWSPDGSKLLYALDSIIKIYDIKSNKIIANIEKDQILPKQISWCSNTSLAYGDKKGVWFNNITNNESVLLAKSDEIIISVECESEQVFYSTSKTTISGSIYLVNIGPEKDVSLLKKLNSVLPRQTDHYLITYTSTTGVPIIVIQTFAARPVETGPNNPNPDGLKFDELTQQYRNEAIQFLNSSGIDTSKLKIEYVILQ